MTLLLTLAAAAVALLVTLVTCIQLLYLESLRIRTRELPSLQFFREALEPRIGLETERGALTFSLVKHIGLGVLGCLIVAITVQGSPLWEALAGAFLVTGVATVLGAHLIPLKQLPERTGELGDAKGCDIVAICRVGVRSATAAAILTGMGFEHVWNLKGGMIEWKDAQLPVER